MASPSPSKKLKKSSHGGQLTKTKNKKKGSGENKTLDDLRTLGLQLLSSRAHINNLPVLLSFIAPSAAPDLALESLISIQSFFVPLFPVIPSSSATAALGGGKRVTAAAGDGGQEDAEAVFRVWLRERFDEFVNKIADIAVSSESAEVLRDVALDAIMDFVKLGKDGKFYSVIYHRFLHRIVNATSTVDPLIGLLASKYFKYMDVRYFSYTSMDKIIRNFESECEKVSSRDDEELSRVENAIHIMFNILSHLPPLEPDKEENFIMWSELGLSSKDRAKITSHHSLTDARSNDLENKTDLGISTNEITKKIRSKFTKAWISFLKLPLPLDVYKEVLVSLHQNVIPYMANPSILCDFLTRSYDIGGVISVMALSGLFILMTQHGLEYPKFYEKLYALLTPDVFMAKHRAVFFLLLDSCLKSSYLPAYLAAAFAKKLSRLALSVPPAGELVIVALVHNLLRRHPSINFLVHQMDVNQDDRTTSVGDKVAGEDTEESDANHVILSNNLGVDPFNIEESDPVKSNAMRSSLWEIETLRLHYSPSVSRFVASLENDLTVRAKTTEVSVADFSSGSYATVFKDEVRRRIKQVPLAFYRVTPCSLLSSLDFPGWTFGDKGSVEIEQISTQ